METVKEIQDAIAEAIAEAEARIAELEAAKTAALTRSVTDAANVCLSVCTEYGVEVSDVVAHLGRVVGVQVHPKAKTSGVTKARKARAVYVDSAGRYYRGGKPPAWLSDEMAAAGIETTREYCAQRMSLVQ